MISVISFFAIAKNTVPYVD